MKNKVYGSLYGVMIGDALGMPVETMKRGAILEKIDGVGVTGFMDPMQTRNDDTKNMLAGDTTDDWQLARVVLSSLIHASGYDNVHMIEAHCEARRTSTFGWGKGSVAAIQDIINGMRDGHTPPPSIAGTGLGNGVMMKIAPLALYHALQLQKDPRGIDGPWWKLFGHHVRMLGAITHSDPRAWIAGFATGMMIVFAARGELQSELTRAACVLKIARYVEQFEDFCVVNPHDHALAKLMRQVAFPHHSADHVLEKFGSKFTVIETLPFTIATFMRHPNDFRAGVLEAVNAGGDTDTNASIVGAMIGANVGAENIPLEWRNFRPEYQEAITLGDQLIALFK